MFREESDEAIVVRTTKDEGPQEYAKSTIGGRETCPRRSAIDGACGRTLEHAKGFKACEAEQRSPWSGRNEPQSTGRVSANTLAEDQRTALPGDL